MRLLAASLCVLASSGCSLIVPQVAHQPVIRNPFPQLRSVAVAPFFNQSDESTLDGREVALAYFAELQSIQGFEVVPIGVVEEAIIAHRVDLSGPGEARRLAKILGVDAVVVGSVTDFTEYYPPRVGLRVEWYTANPGYHEIPAGYGLPWGTAEEEFIPDSLVYESQMALARAEMAALAPDCESGCEALPVQPTPELSISSDAATIESTPAPAATAPPGETLFEGESTSEEPVASEPAGDLPATSDAEAIDQSDVDQSTLRVLHQNVLVASYEESLPAGDATDATAATAATGAVDASAAGEAVAPAAPNWPVPPCATAGSTTAPAAKKPACFRYNGPVLSHTKIYHGDDAYVTQALEGYVSFRDDHRLAGWKSYLSRSDDYVRFCCHMHICEMLSARGGARETGVVFRWPDSR
jgi:hypothetical protein